ncbi:hypothetical protein [Pseudomonas chlororaphis]|uniref:hypothetical protein n=1 Tax=Pseudomonas chlororaphis TaxID=587753 RepID=UPI000BE243D3|nr:hypothetical protein [Pseudomonas chlororaphis]
MEKPIIDEMFELIVRGELEKLESISRPEDAIHIRSIVSTSNNGGVNLAIDLEEITSLAPWITPIFHGPKLYLMSASTALQSSISGGKSNITIDWSFSFDSNVAEKVRAYVNHENINSADQERVITLIRLKNKYSLQTDLIPFLFENLRLSRNDTKNDRPLNTILAFKKLDHLDLKAFEKNPKKPLFQCDEEDLIKSSIKTYEDLVNAKEVKNREHKALFTQVILFELAIIWLKRPSNSETAFRDLIDFCVLHLKKLPKYELLLSLKFLENPTKIRFFGPLSGVSKKLTKELRGMAWDISHMRSLETLSTASNHGSFFIPFFVSFDERFSEILKQHQIQFLLMDDRLKRMQSATPSEMYLQQKINSCMSQKVLQEMTHLKSEERRQHKTPTFELEHILYQQEKILEQLVEDTRANRSKT